MGVFYGHKKPENIEDFLNYFVLDLKDVLDNPAINNKIFCISVRAFVCDA